MSDHLDLFISEALRDGARIRRTLLAPALVEEIAQASRLLVTAVMTGKKVLFCGNGGSAADAQHIAAELVGRYVLERPGLPGIALTVDTSILTAIGNDYGFDKVFSRQVEALGQEGDVLVAITTSGGSPNVRLAMEAARAKKMKIVGQSDRGMVKHKTPISNRIFGLLANMRNNMQGAKNIAANAQNRLALGGAPVSNQLPAFNAPGYASVPPPSQPFA